MSIRGNIRERREYRIGERINENWRECPKEMRMQNRRERQEKKRM